MAAKKQKATKQKKKPAASAPAAPRVRKLKRKDKKKAAKLTKSLPGSFVITGRALKHLWRHRRVFLLTYVVYALLYIVFVRGMAMNFQLSSAREVLEEVAGTEIGAAGMVSGLFGALLSTAGETSGESAAVYQIILFVLISLVIIWLLRATYENRFDIRVKQAFYQSAYPLVPYILVGLVILLQAFPALIGFSIYTTIVSGEYVISGVEHLLWLVVVIAGVGVSSYLMSSSVFASYIVTLPGSEPMESLRAARKLVKYHRFAIIRKVLFLPFIAFLFLAAVFIPLILVAPVIAEVLFMVISMFAVFVLHAYFYTLYRELL